MMKLLRCNVLVNKIKSCFGQNSRMPFWYNNIQRGKLKWILGSWSAKRLCLYIHDNYSEPISVADISSQVYLSPSKKRQNPLIEIQP